MADTTRDYGGMIASCENVGEPIPDTGDALLCVDCRRPAYYDETDGRYHHAVDAATPCFLIPAEDRPDDTNHPLVSSGRVAHPDVVVQLTGTDGNVFSIIGTVARALNDAGLRGEALTFTGRARACHSYDDVLVLAMQTVGVL